jgi:hypothetical protein
MKSIHIFVIALALAVCCAPALAQHGHPGGMGGGMGGGASMNHGASDHAANAGNNMSASHGQTMNDILTRNTQLAGKIQHLTGMSAQQACTGFKNLGQCVAAAHVSKNLGISFSCLQADMTGTALKSSTATTACPANTGSKSMSLGKAIQTLSPTSDSKTEAKKASKQADEDIKESNS